MDRTDALAILLLMACGFVLWDVGLGQRGASYAGLLCLIAFFGLWLAGPEDDNPSS